MGERTTAAAQGPIAAARSLRGLIDSSASVAEREGRLDETVIAEIRRAGLFDLLVPQVLGGMEAAPVEAIDAMTEIAYADGSHGWVFMASSTASGLMGSYLGESAVEAVFGTDKHIGAGQTAPLGSAVRVDGGYFVSGRFSFGSGALHADWMLGGFLEKRHDAVVTLENGRPNVLIGVVPAAEVRLLGNWSVLGLAGTGSVDYEILPQVIHPDFMFPATTSSPLRGGPIYRLGVKSLAAMGHAAFALGVARRLLDEVAVLAQTKHRFGRQPLVEQSTFQSDYARAEASWRAAASFVRDVFANSYDAARVGVVALELRAACRLATVHAARVGYDIAEKSYFWAGTDALRNGGVIQRCFRDLHASSQHTFVDDQILIDSGKVMLGCADPTAIL